MARQPEAPRLIQSNMYIGFALTEALAADRYPSSLHLQVQLNLAEDGEQAVMSVRKGAGP